VEQVAQQEAQVQVMALQVVDQEQAAMAVV